jgi:hypothetical protein
MQIQMRNNTDRVSCRLTQKIFLSNYFIYCRLETEDRFVLFGRSFINRLLVVKYFPDHDSVNQALRSLTQITAKQKKLPKSLL